MFPAKIHRQVETNPAEGKTTGILRSLFLAGLLLLTAWLVYFAVFTATIPYPIEYREGASQVMTQILLMGGNPFSLQYQPLGMNNYGILYSLIVYPFAAAFGNTLAVHRVVNLLFLLFSSVLIFKTISKHHRDPCFPLACSLFVLIPLAGRGALGAFPSIVGTFLFLAGILIPFNRSFDTPGLLLGALFCLAAFYSKPYFLLSFGVVASYVFLFVSKRNGLLYSLFFVSIFSVSGLVARYVLDLYFVNTIVGNMANTTRSFDHLAGQLVEFLKEFLPALGLAVFIVLPGLAGERQREQPFGRGQPAFDFGSGDRPLLTQPFDYLVYFLACSVLAFLFILGPHIGSYMTYAYQIVVPAFLLWLFQQLGRQPRLALISMPLLLLNLAIVSGILLNPGFLSQKESPEWARLYDYVEDRKLILNSPVIVPAMLQYGMIPVDSGQTKYFYSLPAYPPNRLVGPPYQAVKSDGRLYKEAIIDLVERSAYDRIILDDIQWVYAFTYEDLFRNYERVGQFTVEMPQADQQWNMDIWEPVKK